MSYDYIVIDFANLVSRCAYVMGEPLTRKDGSDSSHVYRTYRSLAALRRNTEGRFVFALEGHPVKRYERFPDYKANRTAKKKEVALGERFDPKPDCLRMCKFMDATFAHCETAEADDVIATFCLRNWKSKILVVSKDRDLWYSMQYHPRIRIMYGDQVVHPVICTDQLKCQPIQVPLLKAIAGDNSDSVPRLKVRGLEGLTTKHEAWMGDDRPVDPDSYVTWAKKYLESKVVEKIEAERSDLDRNFDVCSLDEDCSYNLTEGSASDDGLLDFLEEFECPSLYGTTHVLTGNGRI